MLLFSISLKKKKKKLIKREERGYKKKKNKKIFSSGLICDINEAFSCTLAQS